MSISRIQLVGSRTGISVTSLATGALETPTRGNLLLAVWAKDKDAGTWTAPTGWKVLNSQSNASVSLLVCYKISDGTETTATASFTTAGGVTSVVMEYSGVSNFSPIGPVTAPPYSDNTTLTYSFSSPPADFSGMAISLISLDSLGDTVAESFHPSSPGFEWITTYFHEASPGNPPIALNEKSVTAGEYINGTFTWHTQSDQATGILFFLNDESNMPDNAGIARAKGGDVFTFDYASADVAQVFTFEEDNWGPSLGNNVDIYDVIRPTPDASGVSLAGEWTCSITLFHLDTFSTAHVVYEGSGFSVEYSLDNTMWTALPQNGVVPLSGDADFDIRVNFAGGVVDDPAELTKLTVYVLKSDTVFSETGRQATFTADSFTDEGMKLTDGRLKVLPDPAERAWGTVEIWARFDQANDGIHNCLIYTAFGQWAGTSYTDGGFVTGGVKVYVDGVNQNSSPNFYLDGKFHHYVIVRNDAVANTQFYLGIDSDGASNPTDITVSHLAVYPTKLTAVDAYNLFAGNDSLVVADADGPTVTEHTTPVDIYAYAWSIVSAGI